MDEKVYKKIWVRSVGVLNTIYSISIHRFEKGKYRLSSVD